MPPVSPACCLGAPLPTQIPANAPRKKKSSRKWSEALDPRTVVGDPAGLHDSRLLPGPAPAIAGIQGECPTFRPSMCLGLAPWCLVTARCGRTGPCCFRTLQCQGCPRLFGNLGEAP